MVLDKHQFNDLVNEFFSESDEDLLGLFAVANAVESIIKEEESARTQSLRIVEKLLEKGMRAGCSPYELEGYCPWPNQDRKAVMDRIRSEWLALGHSPGITDIAWFGPPE